MRKLKRADARDKWGVVRRVPKLERRGKRLGKGVEIGVDAFQDEQSR